jgi:DNA-binding NarL/FixJ family response regulator
MTTDSRSHLGAAASRGGAPDIGALRGQPHVRRGVPMRDEPIRIVLADDHTLFREGIRLLLRHAPEVQVVGEAENGADAVALARQFAPHLLILDLDMPRMDGIAALRELRATAPEVRVLILTVHAERERLLTVLEMGAAGYLTKEAATRELVDAIRAVAAGEIYVQPSAVRVLAKAAISRSAGDTARGRFEMLSDREQAVLRQVAEGYSGVEIARRLNISAKTVDAYKRRIEARLGLSHRTQVVRFALEAGLLDARS